MSMMSIPNERALNDDTFVYNIIIYKLLPFADHQPVSLKLMIFGNFLEFFRKLMIFPEDLQTDMPFFCCFQVAMVQTFLGKKTIFCTYVSLSSTPEIRKQHLRGFSCNFKNLHKNLVWKNPTSKCKTPINSFVSYD
jgi:hypothetical protein